MQRNSSSSRQRCVLSTTSGQQCHRCACRLPIYWSTHCLVMDFLDVSLAFPVGWHDTIDILEINSHQIMREREKVAVADCSAVRTGNAFQTPPTSPPTNSLCTDPWPQALSFPRKQKEPCEYKDTRPALHTHLCEIRLIKKGVKNISAHEHCLKMSSNGHHPWSWFKNRHFAQLLMTNRCCVQQVVLLQEEWIAIMLQLQQRSGLYFMQLKRKKNYVHRAKIKRKSIVLDVLYGEFN